MAAFVFFTVILPIAAVAFLWSAREWYREKNTVLAAYSFMFAVFIVAVWIVLTLRM